MRIGMMCHASFGGSGRIGIELALALARHGHRVHLFTRTPPLGGGWGPIPNVELHTLAADGADEPHPSTLHTDWSDQDIQDYISLILGVMDTEGLDALHYHNAVPFAFFAERLQTLLGDAMPRLVGTLHGTDVTAFGKAPDVGPRLTKVLQSSDYLTTVSSRHAELATTGFDLPSPPQVIPNFVDLSRFWPTAGERSLAQMQCRPRLVHVSNFRPIKDPQSMARIFLEIRARMEAELWLIGDGEELPVVRAMFEESAFADDVCYLGLQRDVAMYLRHTDLLLMTSLYESFCLVALEAMACGVPVLATAVGGLPEVVAHGQTGMLFPLGDHAMAADMAVRLLSDPLRHRGMRQAAIRQAQQFDVDDIVLTYEEYYQHQVPAIALDSI
jgi:N-acetyl-alpha-D-glucosaminyl L-malate synthase BshA